MSPDPTAGVRHGASWPLGTANDVAWIAERTTTDATITSAIPALFDVYATIVRPEYVDDQQRHDEAMM